MHAYVFSLIFLLSNIECISCAKYISLYCYKYTINLEKINENKEETKIRSKISKSRYFKFDCIHF